MALKEKLTLLGDRVVIQLENMTEHTITEAGIMIVNTELAETDGGRLTTKLSNKTYLAKGEILLLSEKARELLPSLTEGDKVYVAPHALNSSNYFNVDRTQLVQDFKGIICVPHTLIEAKLND